MPARVELIVRRTDGESLLIMEPTGEFTDVILYFGIIDILQDYDISKKLEHAYKSIQYDPTSISAVDPKQYSKRFRDFIYKVFTEETQYVYIEICIYMAFSLYLFAPHRNMYIYIYHCLNKIGRDQHHRHLTCWRHMGNSRTGLDFYSSFFQTY